MKNILKKHDISLRLLSLLLSVVLWAVVMDMDNPERPRTFDNIPVRISGETVLQQQTGLSLIEGADSTVKITLRGPSKTLGDIKASQIAASVDISGLTEANEYDLPVSITVSRSGLEVEYVSPSKVHVRVDKALILSNHFFRFQKTFGIGHHKLAGTLKKITIAGSVNFTIATNHRGSFTR